MFLLVFVSIDFQERFVRAKSTETVHVIRSIQGGFETKPITPYCNIITFFFLFVVVEQVESSASLYASSIQGHHLCLLVKQLPVSKSRG